MKTCLVMAALCAFLIAPCGCTKEGPAEGVVGKAGPAAKKTVIRVGHFPNITHAQGVIGHGLSRKAQGWFEERLGPDVEIQWFVYNAGPSAMEAIFAGSIDLTYVGPNPALNAYMRSRGDEIRVVSGAAFGGAGLVVQGDGRIRKPEDFRGRKIATPQLGNTQDVACRSWLKAKGYNVTLSGGDVAVLPTANPDQLTLFAKGDLDGVWTVEPWVSRLILESKGTLFLEEPDAVTTILVSSVRFLREHRDLARKFLQGHLELTTWMEKNPGEAQDLVRGEIKIETTRDIAAEVLTMAWKRLKFTGGIALGHFEKSVAEAKDVGFIPELVDLSRLLEKP